MTASIGLAVAPTTGPPRDRTDLLREADHHLYAAKDGGRNRVQPTITGPDVETLESPTEVATVAVNALFDEGETSGAASGDEDLARLLLDLETSYEGRDGAPTVLRGLLRRLPDTAGSWVQRSRLTLLGVDELVRDHGPGEAARVLVKIRDRAAARGHRAVQVGAWRSLSWLSRKVGDPSVALEHALAALALDGDDLDAPLRCRVRLALADALVECGSFDDARPRFRDALAHARSVDTPWLSVLVLNNWAYAELLAGELDASMELVQQLQAIARHRGVPLDLSTSETAAEVLHALGRSAEAAAMLRKSLDEDRRHAPIVASGCWLTLAQIERAIGNLEAASRSLDAADRLTGAHAIHVLAVEAMGERAELLAALGDLAGAYDLHRAFHDETLRLRSDAGEARAQTLHAMFEADEARRTSTRYREMSYLDPLTGLFNRRHVDEDLERRLAVHTTPTQPLSVALVDLDHFKRVNDTCSHETGDIVLTHVASMLKDATGTVPDAYAARLGGEEFLLVLPALDLAAAREVAEGLRQQIHAYDWSPLAPTVPLTASIGLASTVGTHPPPPDRAELLRRADHHLYAAKKGGRNRVEPTFDPTEEPARDPGRPTPGAPA